MATATELVLSLSDTAGTKHSLTVKNVDSSTATSSIKALGNGLIANTAIFKFVLATLDSAVIKTTTSTAVDIS